MKITNSQWLERIQNNTSVVYECLENLDDEIEEYHDRITQWGSKFSNVHNASKWTTDQVFTVLDYLDNYRECCQSGMQAMVNFQDFQQQCYDDFSEAEFNQDQAITQDLYKMSIRIKLLYDWVQQVKLVIKHFQTILGLKTKFFIDTTISKAEKNIKIADDLWDKYQDNEDGFWG